MPFRAGGTTCSLTGRIGSVGCYIWVGEKYVGDLRFCIASDSLRVSWYFRYLYIANILWNMIHSSLVPIYESRVFLKLGTFTNPVQVLIFGLHVNPHFYSPA